MIHTYLSGCNSGKPCEILPLKSVQSSSLLAVPSFAIVCCCFRRFKFSYNHIYSHATSLSSIHERFLFLHVLQYYKYKLDSSFMFRKQALLCSINIFCLFLSNFCIDFYVPAQQRGVPQTFSKYISCYSFLYATYI